MTPSLERIRKIEKVEILNFQKVPGVSLKRDLWVTRCQALQISAIEEVSHLCKNGARF
jgi:hypothetical protein